MFGKRSDGKKLKNIDPIILMTTYIMPKRNDAMVHNLLEENCDGMDAFIKKKADEGIKVTYMDILICVLMRMYAERPKMNRFVMNGRIYSRNEISIGFTVKKRLTEEAGETTVKLTFKGTESFEEVRQMVHNVISQNKGEEKSNGTDKTAKLLLKTPRFVLKMAMGLIRFMDRHGMLPKSLINVSPFHASCFLTNMKSISATYVYHHIYNFGTLGLFVGLGKEQIKPVYNDLEEKFEAKKVIQLGLVIDERICDGFYNSKSIKLCRKYIKFPELMEEGLKELPKDLG